jgi:hypothetical protein
MVARLDQHLPEARDRFYVARNPSHPLECDYRQDEIEEDTCAKRYEQKNAETTKPAICHDPMKLPENRPADKRFPHDFDSFHPDRSS